MTFNYISISDISFRDLEFNQAPIFLTWVTLEPCFLEPATYCHEEDKGLVGNQG